MPAFLVRVGMRQRPLGESLRLFPAASQHVCLSQGGTTKRLKDYYFRCTGLLYRLCKQRHRVSDAPAQGVCRTQGRSNPGKQAREARALAEAHGAFERGESPRQVALAKGQ